MGGTLAIGFERASSSSPRTQHHEAAVVYLLRRPTARAAGEAQRVGAWLPVARHGLLSSRNATEALREEASPLCCHLRMRRAPSKPTPSRGLAKRDGVGTWAQRPYPRDHLLRVQKVAVFSQEVTFGTPESLRPVWRRSLEHR